jgi:hypothetical protein
MKRYRGPRKIAELLPAIAGQAIRRYGFAEARLLTHWRALLGETLGARTVPVRLRFPFGERQGGVLVIRASGPVALEVQHLAPQLIERLNGFFGYPAVVALRIEQGPVPHATPLSRGPEPALDADDPALKAVSDEALRQALARLKANLRTRRKRVRESGTMGRDGALSRPVIRPRDA